MYSLIYCALLPWTVMAISKKLLNSDYSLSLGKRLSAVWNPVLKKKKKRILKAIYCDNNEMS